MFEYVQSYIYQFFLNAYLHTHMHNHKYLNAYADCTEAELNTRNSGKTQATYQGLLFYQDRHLHRNLNRMNRRNHPPLSQNFCW